MAIPNPLYDTSFKIMMQDPEIADKIISALTGKKVRLLHQSMQDYQLKATKQGGNHRLDYIGIIDDNGVQKKVMIELQRSEQVSDYQRFRRYLGFQMMYDHYQDIPYSEWQKFSEQQGFESSKESYDVQQKMLKEHGPLEIITLYLLNFTIGIESAIFESPDFYIDRLTHEHTKATRNNSPFCRFLHHKFYVIQFPLVEEALKKFREKGGNHENQEMQDLENLLEILLLGAKNKNYLLKADYESYTGLAQTVYKKLNIAYEKDENIRFALLDEERLEIEIKRGLDRTARKMAEEIAKNKIEKAELKAKKEVEKAELKAKKDVEKAELQAKKEVEQAQKNAENAKKEVEKAQKYAEDAQKYAEDAQKQAEDAQKEIYSQKLVFAKKLLAKGFTIEEVANDTGLTKQEIEKYCKI